MGSWLTKEVVVMARTAPHEVTTNRVPTLYVALELSKETWKLALATSRTGKVRIRNVKARDLDGFLEAIRLAKRYFGLREVAPVRSCYEAGRDGFWIHRFLESKGIQNWIVDPASIEVNRRQRRAKTDRLDAKKLVQLLARQDDGEDVLRKVHAPPPEAEDERLLSRELDSLKRQRTRLVNQIRGKLFTQGVVLDRSVGSFKEQELLDLLERTRQWNGSALPPELMNTVRMCWAQYSLIAEQIKELEDRQRQLLRDARKGAQGVSPSVRKAAILSELRGIGEIGGFTLANEFFGWRSFNNRGEVGALAGLTGTPHQSGNSHRDQGISKSGNPRVRKIMIELAWLWLRWQPDSKTTRWFHEHVGKGGSRSKRKAIVAVARKLLVELWHYVEHGVVPDGAILTNESRTPAA